MSQKGLVGIWTAYEWMKQYVDSNTWTMHCLYPTFGVKSAFSKGFGSFGHAKSVSHWKNREHVADFWTPSSRQTVKEISRYHHTTLTKVLHAAWRNIREYQGLRHTPIPLKPLLESSSPLLSDVCLHTTTFCEAEYLAQRSHWQYLYWRWSGMDGPFTWLQKAFSAFQEDTHLISYCLPNALQSNANGLALFGHTSYYFESSYLYGVHSRHMTEYSKQVHIGLAW
eukprot:1692344-Pyramimonas_sp.AAC.1